VMEQELKKIHNQLRVIRVIYKKWDALLDGNEYLSLSKPTPENLTKYQVFSNSYSVALLFTLFMIPNRFIRVTIRTIAIGFKKRNQVHSALNSGTVLYVSHFFGDKSLRMVDEYFGEVAHKKDKAAEFIYFDQTKFRLSSHTAIDPKSNSTYELLGISKLGMLHFIILLKNLFVSLSLLFHSLREKDRLLRAHILNVALSQVDFETIRNQFYSIELSNRILSNNYRELWLTFEGHAYERAIVSRLLKSGSGVNINFFQHAPIVPQHFGIHDTIQDFGADLCFYTSGRITLNFMIDKYSHLRLNFRLLGSKKSIGTIQATSSKTRINPDGLLFLAEGTEKSLLDMVSLAVQLRSLNPIINLVVRPHPNTPRDKFAQFRETLNQFGVEFSEDLLINDFSKAVACVYRSSATAIEAMNYEILPVYFDPQGSRALDCLAIGKLRYPMITNHLELNMILTSKEFNFDSNLFSSSATFQHYAREYFTPVKSNFEANL